MNMDKVKNKIDKLRGYYQYTNPNADEINIFKKLNIPIDYIEFIKKFGIGLILQDILNLWIKPEDAYSVYGKENLKDFLIFGENLSGEMYAFDTKNNWEVVDIDADGNIVERYGDFETFINTILDEIIESMENE